MIPSRARAHVAVARSLGPSRPEGSAALALIAYAVLSAAAPAGAAVATESGLEGVGTKMSDEALAGMRGKFITPQSVSYFGIQMLTSWQGGDGITTNARLMFNVAFANGAGTSGQPQLFVSWSREGDPGMDVPGFGDSAGPGYVAFISPESFVPVSSLNGVDGVVQSNVVAGADNQTRNAMTVAVVPLSAIVAQASGTMQPVSGSTTKAFADGDRIDFIFGGSGVGMNVTSGQGPDGVRQFVESNLGRIAQETVLTSDKNAVFNMTSILVGVDPSNQVDAIRVDQALSAMKMNGL